MKKIKATFFFMCICTIYGHAQDNLMNREIQQARNFGEQFEITSAVLTSMSKNTSQNDRIQEQFINPQEVYILHYDRTAIRNSGASMTLQIPLDQRTMQLELRKIEMDYIVTTSCGQEFPANKNIRHYQGVVKGDQNSLVAITFGENEVIGLVATNEGNFNIAFDQQLGEHIFFNDRNVKHKPEFICDTEDDEPFDGYSPEDLSESTENSTNLIDKVVRLYFETAVDMFQELGSYSAVETYVAGLYNQVAALYRQERIITTLSQIFVWTTTFHHPYTETTTKKLLTQFQNHRTSFNGDLGQLLTFRIEGGRAAGFKGLCNSNVKKKLSVSGVWNQSIQLVPIYSWSVKLVTHEFGHLFGSKHTHACVWNGNWTAIDGCAKTEGICKKPAIPVGGGTIMSYCQHESGIDFTLGFGPQPGNVIRNKVKQASCLKPVTVTISGLNPVCFSTTYSIKSNIGKIEVLSWSITPNDIFTLTPSADKSTTTVTVITCNLNGQPGTLTAMVNINGDLVPITKHITVCNTASMAINGAGTLSGNGTEREYNIRYIPWELESDDIRWYCDGNITIATSPSRGPKISARASTNTNGSGTIWAFIPVEGCPDINLERSIATASGSSGNPPCNGSCGGQCSSCITGLNMWDYLITKNPIDKELQVHIVSRSSSVGDSGDLPTEPIDNSEINISFKLLDNTGVTHRRTNHRRRKNRETTSVEFDVSNLREGTYYLHIESDGQIIKEQIIVTR